MARIKVWNGSSWDYVGNDIADVVTTGGSQTLTNKTLTEPVITPESWTSVTFQNSWSNYSGASGTYNSTQYYKTPDGLVHIKGLVTGGSSASAVIFTLPVGYRPAQRCIYTGYSAAGVCRIDITDTGTVFVNTGGSTSFTSLDGIIFRAA